MSHAGGSRSCAIVRYRLTEDGCVDQSFTPDGRANVWPTVEQLYQISVGDGSDDSFADRADRMIHNLDEKALRIRHVAREMK
jgi:hypothetical protein